MDEAIWVLAPPSGEAAALAAALGVPAPIAQVLINRRVGDPAAAERFLRGGFADLHDPFLMAGMGAAVDRILRAVETGEKILVFGDYDVDGVLSVVMLHKAISQLGGAADYFIPERLKDGYGIKDEHVEIASARGAGLVISVDCGIKAVGFAARAAARGIDVIITDHHRPGAEIPAALAVLDPVLEGAGYPDRGLAGVGVAFKLIQALFARRGRASLLRHYLKLVSIGTVADVAALRGENRIFVRLGLAELARPVHPGLKSLLEVSGLRGRITEGDIGFRLGPRLNAAGRLETAELAVRLFFSQSPEETADIARRLDELNARRQSVEDRIVRQAAERIRAGGLDRRYRLLILGCEEWHRGIVGIVASKIKDAFSRPALLFAYEEGRAHGSGRSISEFSLIDCLDACRGHLLSYGGHPMAVGCTLQRDALPSFRGAANAVASSRIRDEDLRRKIALDARLDFSAIDPAFLSQHARLAPFGIGNPRPVFLTEKAEVVAAPRVLQGKHLKLLVRQSGRTFEAMAWNRADWAGRLAAGARLDLAYTIQTSVYQGEERLHLGLEGARA